MDFIKVSDKPDAIAMFEAKLTSVEQKMKGEKQVEMDKQNDEIVQE